MYQSFKRTLGFRGSQRGSPPSPAQQTASGSPPAVLSMTPDYSASADPTRAWLDIKNTQQFVNVDSVDPNTAKPDGHTRVVMISDTHSLTKNLVVPDGDILIHAGDFSNTGEPHDVDAFNSFLKALPHKHKIVIAGNHDLTFDEASYPILAKRFNHKKSYDPKLVKQLLTDCIYLEDTEATVEGFRIYGSPWQPEFCGWGFNLDRGKPLDEVWSKIPDGIDILITHGPPLGRGDLLTTDERSGCYDLLRHVQLRVRPMLHVFGHIHEAYGLSSDGTTIYANASTCTVGYRPVQKPLVLDLLKAQ